MFDDLVRRYRDGYPDEDIGALVADVTAAAAQSRKVLMQATSARHEMAILQGLLDVCKEDAARDKPLWRRMVENYFLNVQPSPIPHRIEKACAHLLAAQQALLARELQLPVE